METSTNRNAEAQKVFGYQNLRVFLYAYLGIFGAALIAFIVRLAKFTELSTTQNVNIFLTSIVLIVVFWESLRFINHWLNRTLPFENNITWRITVQILLGIAVGLTMRFLVYVFGESSLPFKLDGLFIAATWVLYIIVPTAVNFIFFTYYLINRWKESLIYNERLEKEKSQVQFDNLRNQMNPHFLFNALTSLNSLIFENQQLASDFLQQLSKVYRYVLQNKDKNFVLLSTELSFIENYVRLLKTRFSSSLEITFDVPGESTEKAIVPVTLQILIENAIKHNIADPSKVLRIDIVCMGDYLVVSNNVQLRRNVESSNKQGLENLRSLYKFLTHRPVIIESTPDRFFVKVPLLYN